MKMQSYARLLLTTTSVVALSAAAVLVAQPAAAQHVPNTVPNGFYAGGSTLASLSFRQMFDCFMQESVGFNNAPNSPPWDGYTFTTVTPISPGQIPSNVCTTHLVQGMYAGVGSGNGFRAYITNSPAQWYGGTLTPTSAPAVVPTPNPAALPPFKDTNNTHFQTYPYAHIDMALSDSPLANTLAALTTVSIPITPTVNWGANVTVGSTGSQQTVSYDTTKYGPPIQMPAFEVGVAIPVNVNSALFQINSQIKQGGNIVQGGAIQLTQAQICAIFSGMVTDWNSNTTIPFRNATAQSAAPFYYANVGNGIATAQRYASASLPITITFRSDGSGTSFIITNYLKNVCPLLDNGTGSYSAIFNQPNLPSTSFQNLINNIVAVRGNGPWNGSAASGNWTGQSGSGGVAGTISDSAANAGFIGYVSSDFTKPYASTIAGPSGTVNAPYSAALQNEALRLGGGGTPSPSNSTSITFIAPTPAGINAAWFDPLLNAQIPNSSSTYADWDVYGKTYLTPTTRGGITYTNQSILATTNQAGAYPLAGTTYMAVYGCYANEARAANVRGFITWLYNNVMGSAPRQIAENNGFEIIPSGWITALKAAYVNAGAPQQIHGSGVGQCVGVPGAN